MTKRYDQIIAVSAAAAGMLMLAFTGYVTKTPQPTVIYPQPAQNAGGHC